MQQFIREIQTLRTRPLEGESHARLQAAVRDALIFVTKLPQTAPEPRVSSNEDGEVVLEWYAGTCEAVVGFEGDGEFGYALLEGGQFVPGQHEGALNDRPLPSDLISYLTKMAAPN